MTVDYGAPLTPDPLSGPAPLAALAQDIAAGAVDTLVITAVNPAYNGARRLQVREAAGARPQLDLLHSVRRRDRRGVQGRGPGGASAGVVERRPRHRRHRVDRPAADRARCGAGLQEARRAAPRSSARATSARTSCCAGYWQAQVTRARRLRRHTGSAGWPTASFPTPAPPVDAEAHRRRRRAGADGRAAAPRAKSGLELAFVADPKLYDGRFANNAWLQELPHPITKLTWDNAAMLSEATAEDRCGSRPATSSRSATAIAGSTPRS